MVLHVARAYAPGYKLFVDEGSTPREKCALALKKMAAPIQLYEMYDCNLKEDVYFTEDGTEFYIHILPEDATCARVKDHKVSQAHVYFRVRRNMVELVGEIPRMLNYAQTWPIPTFESFFAGLRRLDRSPALPEDPVHVGAEPLAGGG